MKILVLDDDEIRQKNLKKILIGHESKHVYTAKDCIYELISNNWDLCLLDHDLGGQQMVESGEETGWQVAKWISEHLDRKPKEVIIHSLNPSGSLNMKSLIPDSVCIPIYMLYQDLGEIINK